MNQRAADPLVLKLRLGSSRRKGENFFTHNLPENVLMLPLAEERIIRQVERRFQDTRGRTSTIHLMVTKTKTGFHRLVIMDADTTQIQSLGILPAIRVVKDSGRTVLTNAAVEWTRYDALMRGRTLDEGKPLGLWSDARNLWEVLPSHQRMRPTLGRIVGRIRNHLRGSKTDFHWIFEAGNDLKIIPATPPPH